MKKIILIATVINFAWACNNSSTDSVQKADSANESRRDSNASSNGKAAIAADKETSDFLVRAMNGGIMEVALGNIADQKAKSERVKAFGEMMIKDHEAANNKIKDLAAARTVELPPRVSDKNAEMMKKVNESTLEKFDRTYIDMMVDDHKEDIKEFEEAGNKINDTEVRQFINNTLPVLRKHLDSCTAIQQQLKKL